MEITRRTILAGCLVVLVALALAFAGCVRVPLPADNTSGTIPGQPEVQRVAAGDATTLTADFRMGVGELRVEGGAPEGSAFVGSFDYAPATWKPSVIATSEAGTVDLRVYQPSDIKFKFGEQRNTWDIKLSPTLESNLRFRLGVGESRIDLSDVDVHALQVLTGVGDTWVDLSGKRAHDLNLELQTGVGNTVVTLPSDCRIDVEGGTSGVGNLKAQGFEPVEGGYRYFGHGGSTIVITLTRGVGDVTFKFAD